MSIYIPRPPRRRGGGGVPGRDPVERFHGFVFVETQIREGVSTPCHRWTGALNSKGYGCFSFGGKGKSVLAPRWALEYLAGIDVPADRVAAHLCGFHACVNTEHLELRASETNKALGDSPCAVNARKTECMNGHPFAGENLVIRPDGHRQCRECQKKHRRRYEVRAKKEGLAAERGACRAAQGEEAKR